MSSSFQTTHELKKYNVFFSSYGTQTLQTHLRPFHFLKYPHAFDNQDFSKIISNTAGLHLAALQNSYFVSVSKKANVLQQVDTCCQDAHITFRQEETPLTPVKKGHNHTSPVVTESKKSQNSQQLAISDSCLFCFGLNIAGEQPLFQF